MRSFTGRAVFAAACIVLMAGGVRCQHRALPEALSLVSGPVDPEPLDPEDRATPDRQYIAERDAMTPEEQQALFTLPEGFAIQLVAAEPELRKPMQLAFDEKGRLLVSTSTNYPLGPAPGLPPSDRVLRIDLDDATGKATRISVLADGFDICSGIEAMPGGRVIVGHAPDIVLLTDADDDGVAEQRETLFTGFKRDDTHELPNSFTWGIDGWLYGLQGHVNVSDVTDKTGKVTAIHHGNVYRMKPDGTAIESWARGMSNPWGLTFDLRQNLFAADCESRPLWQIVRGYAYQGFLQAPDPLGNAPYITEDHHGASGFAGLVFYSDTAFPADYRACLYLGNPITGIVHRDALRREGGTWHAVRQPDFLTSDDPWFRPVDVELGPDGALYIADWYNNIISHVEVPLDDPRRDKAHGRIWRVVYTGGHEGRTLQTDWSAMAKAQLVEALAEPNTWVRRQAAAQLMARYDDGLGTVMTRLARNETRPVVQRVEALWLAARCGALTEDGLVRFAADPDELVRSQAARLLEEQASGEPEARDALLRLAADESALAAREASVALSRMSDVSILTSFLNDVPPPADEDSLLDYGQRLAMSAQMKDEEILSAIDVAPSSPAFERYAKVLGGTPTEAAASKLAGYIASGAVRGEEHFAALVNVLEYGALADITEVFADPGWPSWPAAKQRQYARALDNFSGRAVALGFPLQDVLQAMALAMAQSDVPKAVESAMEIASRRGYAMLTPKAGELVMDTGAPVPTRSFAATVYLEHGGGEAWRDVLGRIADPNEPVAARTILGERAGANAALPGRPEELLAALVGAPGPVVRNTVLALLVRKESVESVFEALEAGTLSPVHVNEHMTRMRLLWAHQDDALLARYDAVVAGAPRVEDAARDRISALANRYRSETVWDTRAGQIAFEQNCMVCHRIGGVGGMRGPNLDGMANRGVDRLLQDMLLPSQDVDPSFRTTQVVLDDGRTVQGQVIEETGDTVTIVDELDWTEYVSKGDIAERRQVMLSPMPGDIALQLTDEDVLNVAAFLLEPPAVIERLVPVPE